VALTEPLQQLKKLIRHCTVWYQVEANTHRLRPRDIGVVLEILCDVPTVALVVEESKLEYRRINTIKRENVLVNQSLPYRHQFPKDLLCFPEILMAVDTKGF